VPRSEKYSHVNMCLNILFAAHTSIIKSMVPKESYGIVKEQMIDAIKKNYEK